MLDIPLLVHLQQTTTRWTPPAALAGRFGLTSQEVRAAVEELTRFGFRIEASPHLGYRYSGPSEQLCPDLIEHDLTTRVIGRQIQVWNSCASTNDLAWAAARSRANHGSVFLAEYQTAGRGRQGAPWFCPLRTGILCSVLFARPDEVPDHRLLTSLAAMAVTELVRQEAGLDARIKWPNDVRVGQRKIAGVLVETRSHASVLGIGLNVNTPSDAFPAELRQQAGSLCSLTGTLFDRSLLTRQLVSLLDHHYYCATTGQADRVWSRWLDLADLVGSRAIVDASRQQLRGRIVDFSPQSGIVFLPDRGGPFTAHPASIVEVQY